MNILFLRRRGLGFDSVCGMVSYLTGTPIQALKRNNYHWDSEKGIGFCRNDNQYFAIRPENTLLIRWGCTSRARQYLRCNTLNLSSAIHTVANKRDFRKLCQADPNPVEIAPRTLFDNWDVREYGHDISYPVILRPETHSQGRRLWVCKSKEELMSTIAEELRDELWYASEYIPKVQEFRVYITNGRVVLIDEKVVNDKSKVAWNNHNGSSFRVLRRGLWNMEVCRIAIRAMQIAGLDFGGVDMMLSEEGKPYLLEINSAPSVTSIHNGMDVSYSQKCMAKAFKWKAEQGEVTRVVEYEHYTNVIHPAVM